MNHQHLTKESKINKTKLPLVKMLKNQSYLTSQKRGCKTNSPPLERYLKDVKASKYFIRSLKHTVSDR